MENIVTILFFLENIKSQEEICKSLKPVRVYDENKNLIDVGLNENETELDLKITVEEIDSILSPFSLIAKTNILNLYNIVEWRSTNGLDGGK